MEEHNECMMINRQELREKFSMLEFKIIICGIEFTLDLDDIDEIFMEKAKKELRETPEIVAQSVKEIRELIAEEPNLRVPDQKEYYELFLRPCKWYARSAFSLMKRYYRFCLNYPHIFIELLPSQEKEVFLAQLLYPLPFRNSDGSRVLVLEMGKKWKPKEVSLEQVFKTLVFTMHAAMLEIKTQIAGVRVVIDMGGLSLSQVTYFTPSFAKMTVDFVQKSLPLRLKSIHIINQPFIFNMVFAFFKPFLEEKIRKRIHFHGTNRESLLAYIDKKILVKKYGGELESSDEPFGLALWQTICVFEDLFKMIQSYGYKLENDKK